jgi:hypothetical protein
MTKRKPKVLRAESQNMRFPQIACAGMQMQTFTSTTYAECALFARTYEQELIRELKIVKMEHPRKPSDSALNNSIMTSLIEAVAHARVWARFKRGGPRNRPKKPAPAPLPAPRAKHRELEDA